MVKLNRLSGHKIGESYGARVGKAELGRVFQKERESVGVERTRISGGFGKQRKDCGTSGESFGVLDCEGLSEFNLDSILIQQCRLVLRHSLSYCVVISSFSRVVLCCHDLLCCHSLLPWRLFMRWPVLLRCHLFLCRHIFFKLHTHKRKHICVERECVVK